MSGVQIRLSQLTITPPPIVVKHRLLPVETMPARMVFVPGGEYRLVRWQRPTDRLVRLRDYFIDMFEVTNEEFNGGTRGRAIAYL